MVVVKVLGMTVYAQRVPVKPAFLEKERWERFAWDNLDQFKQETLFTEFVRCKIMSSRNIGNGVYTYTVLYKEGRPPAEGMPREAFLFRDKYYTNDVFLPNAFRHDIRIPDDLFPDTWKNLQR